MSDSLAPDRLNEIAIIGMSCRFPGANNIQQYWQNLRDGVESIRFFTDQEMLDNGVSPKQLADPNYVKASGVIEGIDQFDAQFFGINAREAEILDPQHRIFMECAWEALEAAGYDAETYAGLIGVYAGESMNNYLMHIYSNPALMKAVGGYRVRIGNDKDHLPTRVSYKLNLRGPSVAVQTACSTSLVAVHLACQSLLNHDCDIALAGGVSISVPQNAGYLYQEGGILSPDGHCRPFDAKAKGTVTGNGAGIVVLKRLADAIADSDNILALIKGSAINNDGSLKVGYTAPSIEGQAEVIALAQEMAGVEPSTISYIEAHGTGTALGDPIEMAALKKVFEANSDKKGYCGVGSVKSNLGHLDAAAGVAGLIKVVEGLRRKQIPASLNYEEGNREIEIEGSPFYVVKEMREWEVEGEGQRRRAGVSSFGIGGTNAHVVLEEWEKEEERGGGESGRPFHLLLLSAKSSTALETITSNLANHLNKHSDDKLADVAYTLQVGRKAFDHRRMAVCSDRDDAIKVLESLDPGRVFSSSQEPKNKPVVFMFPGQGAQYVNMAKGLYQTEGAFRNQVDHCSEILSHYLGFDLRGILYPEQERVEQSAEQLNQTYISQPALFTIEYSLARLWMDWGIRPHAMIGHSIGEYVAACLADVFTLEEALMLVAMRGQIMQKLPTGSMLAVQLSERDVKPRLGRHLSLAAINGPSRSVIAGLPDAIEALQNSLNEQSISCRRLQTSHAFHSWMMEPAVEPFIRQVKKVSLKPPKVRYLSNVTGGWISQKDATDPAYWGRHLRDTVRFGAGISELTREGERILLEVGPGHTLSLLARQQGGNQIAVPSMRNSGGQKGDEEVLLDALGRMWLEGVVIDWTEFYADEDRSRVILPTYPFERSSYWVELSGAEMEAWGEQQSRSSQPTLSRQAAQQEPAYMPAGATAAILTGAQAVSPARSSQRERVISKLNTIINELTGVNPGDIDIHASFLDMGVDSLLLVQANQAIQGEFGIDISLVQLLEELTTIDALAAYICEQLPQEDAAATPLIPVTLAQLQQPLIEGPAINLDALFHESASDETFISVRRSAAEQIKAQLDLVSQQLGALLDGNSTLAVSNQSGIKESDNGHEKAFAANTLGSAPGAKALTGAFQSARQEARSANRPAEPFIPYQPIRVGQTGGLSPRQQRHLDELIARYTQRTEQSKNLTQRYRASFAENRASADFRLLWKEMVYPIVGHRALGSRLWDVDGNEYVDLTMGFGVSLFGHSPDFVIRAIEEQLKLGMQLGPQTETAGRVAELICELTGMERAAFCNSGTEAVMSALRLARTVTRRNKIALFAGSYHGSFDGTLVRGLNMDGQPRSVPMAPGVPQGMVADLLVLNYDDPASLDIIEAHAGELAGVLVEPVQSRRPELQPKAFLSELRRLTEKTKTPLIFDEVITGFRCHPGGAQAWFGVKADITTYGKVLGGGMPIGIVAGKAEYLDAIDGGMWGFGDNSYPQREKTYFAGTFCKHPLAMAAALAVLNHMKASGPALQQDLNERAGNLVSHLNQFFKQERVPIELVHFGSLLRFVFTQDVKFVELFFYHLIEKGVYVWEGRNCFLSTAHTREDIDLVIEAVKQTVAQMREGGFIQGLLPAQVTSIAALNERSAVEQSVAPADVEEQDVVVLPLTDAQKQLWVLTRMGEEASRAYNESLSLHMRGQLDLDAMRRAFQSVVDRHQALRTTFSPDGDNQRISPAMNLEIPLIDLSHLEGPGQRARFQEWVTSEVQQIFDITEGPLLRVKIVRLEAQHHVIVLTMHHIITDAWSTGILLNEVREFYSANCQGLSLQLPEPARYGDYIQRQAARQESSQSADEAYWLEQFVESPPALDLPADHPRPAVQAYAGARQTLTIDSELSDELRRLSARQGCTLFMTLLAAYNVLLYRLTGQQDIVVGVPAAGQLTADDKALVGYCINLLALRSRLSGDWRFTQLLDYEKALLLDAHIHQNYPLGKLIKKLNLRLDPSRPPVVSTVFNLDRGSSKVEFYDLQVEVVSNPGGSAKFDFDFGLVDKEGALSLECEYNTALFDAETIGRWMSHYCRLLEAIAAEPESRVGELPMMSESEQRRLLVEWNQTAREYPKGSSIQEQFEEQASQRAESVAVEQGNEQISYGEMNRRANQLGHYLRAIGVGPEVLVGLCMERSIDMMIGLLGILKAGGAYLPLDPTYPKERLEFMIEDSGIKVLLTQERLIENLPSLAIEVICLDRDRRVMAEQSASNPVSGVRPENTAYVIYTSGSTGKPKGVMVEHRSLAAYIQAAIAQYEMKPSDRVLQFASISFDWSADEIYPCLTTGATLVLRSDAMLASVYTFLTKCEQWRLTVIMPTTAYWHEITNLLDSKLIDLPPSLRLICIGGERVLSDYVAKWRKHVGDRVKLLNTYGPTEATVVTTVCEFAWTPEEIGRMREMPIGKPVDNVKTYVLDGRLHPLPVGVVGELYIGGSGVARGYLNEPAATAEKFIPDPFGPHAGGRLYKTGDRVRLLANGNIEFVGRIDEQVKIRGYRVELGEIEWTLSQHTDVENCVVVARDEGKQSRQLVAYAQVNSDKQITGSELRNYLKRRLPEYMVPGALMIIEHFPLTPNGKIDKKALPAPDGRRPQLGSDYTAPQSRLQEFLASLWQDVLGIEKIGIDDDFFDLGGDSIKAVLFTNKLQGRLGEQLYIVALFEAPTIAELSAYLGKYYADTIRKEFGEASFITTANGQKPDARRQLRMDAARIEQGKELAGKLIKPLSPRRSGDAKKNPQSIFILSPPRSGSTLLRVMLAGHPRLFAPPELELLQFNTLDEREAEFKGGYRSWTEGATRALMEIKRCDADEAKRLMQEYEQKRMSVKDFYLLIQDSIGNRRLVDKTPSYAQDIEVLKRAEEDFENPLFIHLLRHPYGMIRSYEEARFAQGVDDLFSQREIAELVWLISHQNILGFLKTIPDDRQHRLRFEDLVKHPEETLVDLCSFLSIEFNAGMMRPYSEKEKKMTDGIHAESSMIGDHKFHQYDRIDETVADRWAEQHEEDFLADITWEATESLGYQRTGERESEIAAARKDLTPIQRAARKDRELFSLSFSQQRLWFLEQWMPGNSAYHLYMAVRLEGWLDVPVLERSINEIIRRHEILRTTFPAIDGKPFQQVAPAQSIFLPQIDLSELPEADREERIRELITRDANRPFNLDRGPLLRFMLLRLAADQYIFALTMHHIISDGWSINIFIEEITSLYKSFANSEPSPLPDLPIQYADFAVWQREQLQGEALNAEIAYWRQQLAGAPALLQLPTDYPRPAIQTARGERLMFELPTDLSVSLKEMSQRHRVTLFMLLLAAYKTLLRWYSGSEDIVIGSPVMNRDRIETERLIGFFINNLVFRTRMSGDPTFRELLSRVREVALGAYAHKDVPFEKLVEELQPERSPSYNPIYQVAFVLQNANVEGEHLAELMLTPLNIKTVTAQFDLTLNITDAKRGLRGSVEYNSDLFKHETIARFITLFETLLRNIVTSPDARLSELRERLSEADRRQQSMAEEELEQARLQKFKRVRRKVISIASSDHGA